MQQQKKSIDLNLLCFCLINYFLNAAVSVIIPFYPPLAKSVGLSMTQIGYILATNPLGGFLFSIALGSKMSTWGRKFCMILGLGGQVITIFAFGAVDLFKDHYWTFLIVSLFSRLFQGLSRAAYASISFAYVPILWPNQIQQKISIMESLTGLGLMSGPFIGAGIYHFFGYQIIFYFFGFIFFLSVIATAIILPKPEKEQEQTKHKMNLAKILFSRFNVFNQIIFNRKVFSLFVVITMVSAGTNFIGPLFTLHMQTYGLKEDQSTLIFGIITVFYVIFINFVPFLTRVLRKEMVLFLGICGCILGAYLIAPAFFLPNRWWAMLIGLPLIGIANALCVLPCIPCFIEFIYEIYSQKEQQRNSSDLASAFFISSYSLGILVGPLLSGSLFDIFKGNDDSKKNLQRSFQLCAYVLAGLQGLASLPFLIFAVMMKGKQSELSRSLFQKNDKLYTENQISLQKEGQEEGIFNKSEKNTQSNDDLVQCLDN